MQGAVADRASQQIVRGNRGCSALRSFRKRRHAFCSQSFLVAPSGKKIFVINRRGKKLAALVPMEDYQEIEGIKSRRAIKL